MRKAKRKNKKLSKAEEKRRQKETVKIARESFVMFCQAVKMMPFWKRARFCWNIMFKRRVR